METQDAGWQKEFGLKVCKVAELDRAIPKAALGVAVIYAVDDAGKQSTFLVLESRAAALSALCAKRLATAKIPEGTALQLAYKASVLKESTPEAVQEACREQVILASVLRRQLRPMMR